MHFIVWHIIRNDKPPQVSVVGRPVGAGDLRIGEEPKDAWHIVNHGHENPLIASGQLLSILAVA